MRIISNTIMLCLIQGAIKITHILRMFQKTDPWVHEQPRNYNRSACDAADESNLHYQATERDKGIKFVIIQMSLV